MIIDKVLKVDEVGRIRESILNMDVLCCVPNFIKYMDECEKYFESISPLEREFYSILKKDLQNFVSELCYNRYYCELNQEEAVRTILKEGFYGFCDRDYGELFDWLESEDSTEEICKALQAFMNKCLDQLVETLTRTEEAKKQKAKDTIEDEIKHYEKRIEEAKEKLDKLA